MAKTNNGEAQLHALVDGKKIIITESSVRRDIRLADEEGIDCLPNSTIFEQLTLMGKPKRKDTQVPQPSDPIEDVPDEAVHKELGDTLVPRNHRGTIAQTRFESVSKHSSDSLLVRGNMLRIYEDCLKLDDLMALCTTLQNKVLDLEKTMTTQRNEIASLKSRVKKLEKKNRSRTHRLKRLYKVGLTAKVESSGNEESLDEEEGAVDAIPLSVKSLNIFDWKIYKEGRKSYYKIMRADGESQIYMVFSQMLKSFDREDLEDLYKLVKDKYESIRPVEDLDLLLWDDLKSMFEPHVEDEIYMLVEKKYPLTPLTLLMLLEKKLITEYESEMAYQLLRFITKQLKKTVNVVVIYRDHHLAEKKKNSNFNATYNLYGFASAFKKRERWFIESIPFINGLVDEDKNVFPDDCVGVSKDNVVDGQHKLGYENGIVNETLVEKNDLLLLEEGDGVLDSEGGGKNHESDNVKHPSTCSRPDMDNTEVIYDGMSIDKEDGKNEHTYSQANPSTLDVLIKEFDYSNDHPQIDVLGDVNDLNRFIPSMNHHATPRRVHVYDFDDDYMNVLNDEEMVTNVSLDDMKLQHEEDNLTVKDKLVEHQPVDELIEGPLR
nr:hypothetical protein [Tanacetum cinerariifolium]